MEKIIFLILSFLSGATELGGILYALRTNFNIVEIVGLGLAYQIGNLVPNPIKLNRKASIFSAVLSSCCFVTFKFINANYWLLFVGFVLIAMSIQSLRSLQKENVSTPVKRLFRIIGFLGSPLMSINVFVCVGVILICVSTVTKWNYIKCELNRPKVGFINAIMITHQIHYFAYAYFILILIANIISKSFNKNSISQILIGVLFTLGWLTYTSISVVLKKEKYFRYFITGHLFLTIVLFSLAYNSDNYWSIILWILTGFGGGTVFCIEKINNLTNESTKRDIVFSENIGHIIGVIFGLVVYLFSTKTNYPVYLSSIFAGVTALLMIIYYVTKTSKFNINAKENKAQKIIDK